MSDKLDRIESRLHDIDKTLVKNTASLEEHMRRTDLLEEAVTPLVKIQTISWGICKIIAGVSVVVGIMVGLAKLIGTVT